MNVEHRAEIHLHPLDPLTAEELGATAQLIRSHPQLGPRILFEQIRLKEPEKASVRGFKPGEQIRRNAFAVVLDRDSEKTFEVTVDLDSQIVSSMVEMPGIQMCVTFEECEEMEQAIKANPEFQQKIRDRGIGSMDQVAIDFFAMANFAKLEDKQRRISQAHCFYVEQPGDNPHVRPIEGLTPVVDLNTMEVLRIEDFGETPIPPDKGVYESSKLDSLKPATAALDITQPDGPGFKVEGWKVSWENWTFRVGFTPKEGLVLHTLSINDGVDDRPVVYRASLSELVVPYGDTLGDHYMNHSFDLGEGVFGLQVNSLKLGCDCLGEIHYFNVDMVNGRGEVEHLPNAICMHEEDYGILWKHTNRAAGSSEVRRSRRLVVSSFFTIGNYDYGIFWYLYLDGTIEFEAKLTGMLYTRAMKDGEEIHYGTQVAPNLCGMIHEHYFNVRLDMAVDGDKNCLLEVEAERVSDTLENPHGNAHKLKEILVEVESQSGRNINSENGRYWKVINRSKTNQLGWHPGYKLMPGNNIKPMHQPGSPFMRRAGFVEHDLWVTAYHPDQIHAPGSYVNQNEGGPGLPEWTQEKRNLVDTDLVIWHTLGVLHMPRPEDFPVMPVEYTGFMLKPVGFFERNPALDLAPPECHRS